MGQALGCAVDLQGYSWITIHMQYKKASRNVSQSVEMSSISGKKD